MDASGFGTSFPSSRLLIGLPDKTPQIRFVDMENLEKEVTDQKRRCAQDGNSSPFVVVLDVPFTICEQLEDSVKLSKTHTTINLTSKLLIVETMLSNEHENVARLIDSLVLSKSKQMGMTISPCGSATVKHGDYSKEPDCSFKPRPVNLRTWPTFVVEVGWAEMANKLAVDAEGWLETELSDVNIVLTIKIERNSPKLTFLKWEKMGPRIITRSNQVSSNWTQKAEVSYANGGTTVSGFLQLPFDKVFGRPQNPKNPREKDIIFTHQDLIDIAEEQWETQGFIR